MRTIRGRSLSLRFAGHWFNSSTPILRIVSPIDSSKTGRVGSTSIRRFLWWRWSHWPMLCPKCPAVEPATGSFRLSVRLRLCSNHLVVAKAKRPSRNVRANHCRKAQVFWRHPASVRTRPGRATARACMTPCFPSGIAGVDEASSFVAPLTSSTIPTLRCSIRRQLSSAATCENIKVLRRSRNVHEGTICQVAMAGNLTVFGPHASIYG
jgi:hypothetical protein